MSASVNTCTSSYLRARYYTPTNFIQTPHAFTTTMPSPPASINRPKNHLIVDATKPYCFSFLKYGREKKVTVDQTAEEATWREFASSVIKSFSHSL